MTGWRAGDIVPRIGHAGSEPSQPARIEAVASSNTDCRRMTAMCVLVAACLLTAACGTRVADRLAALRSPSPTSAPVATTTTTDVAAAKAEIAANWEMFFSAKTTVALNGSLFSARASLDSLGRTAEASATPNMPMGSCWMRMA